MILLLLLCLLNTVRGDNYAVIIAGSNAWYNYRHQADASHAYQVLVNEGHFPEENVILMMYDDVANNEENKAPGKIYNHVDGPNVYPGSEKVDYSGDDVNAETFLRILNGTASGKVLNSGRDDNVFIYYVDHGAVGLVGMPIGPNLYADQLLEAFQSMFDNKQYNEMVVYIEACESGSMLQNLTSDLRIFGTTAAQNNESSWACYFDEYLGVYLGDEYSVSWLEDSDTVFSSTQDESLETQFRHVRANVNKSTPMQYGAMGMSTDNIRDFQQEENTKPASSEFLQLMHNLLPKIKLPTKKSALKPHDNNYDHSKSLHNLIEVSDARDVKRNTILNNLQLAQTSVEFVALSEQLYQEEISRTQFNLIFIRMAGFYSQSAKELNKLLHESHYKTIHYKCLRAAYEWFEDRCMKWTDYGLKYVKTLVNLCDIHCHLSESEQTMAVKSVIESSC